MKLRFRRRPLLAGTDYQPRPAVRLIIILQNMGRRPSEYTIYWTARACTEIDHGRQAGVRLILKNAVALSYLL